MDFSFVQWGEIFCVYFLYFILQKAENESDKRIWTDERLLYLYA